MKTSLKKFLLTFYIFFLILIASLSLTGCVSETPDSTPENSVDQQIDITTPIVGLGEEKKDGTKPDVTAYPDTEPVTQISEIITPLQNEAYPDPDNEEEAQIDVNTPQEEAYPTPLEEPTPDKKPTPRGNELVATSPYQVHLASGELQLVELFAFW